MISLEEFHKNNVELCEELLREEGDVSPQVTLVTRENKGVVLMWDFVNLPGESPLALPDYAESHFGDWELMSFMCVFAIGRMLKNYRRGAISRSPDKRREMWVFTTSREDKVLITWKRIIGEGKDIAFQEVKAGDDPFFADARPSPQRTEAGSR